jgi:hypothetical protein
MSDAPNDELLRLILAEVPRIAAESVAVPRVVLGQVDEYDEGLARVVLDGDTLPSTIRVAVTGVVAGDRVVVLTYPPHGALVIGVIGGIAGPVDPVMGQTFHQTGALTASESDIHYVPFAKTTSELTGGVTVYGSGTVEAVLKQNGSPVGSPLSITGTGMFTAAIGVDWAAGDAMTVETTDPGTGCSGLVVTEVP